MITIFEHIEYLLLDHDCISIPDFGAIIANYVPARISDDNQTITPPMRTLVFNSAIRHNDGILANSVMRKKGISYITACAIIKKEVEKLNSLLNQGKGIRIRNIGTFRCKEGKINFTPVDASLTISEYFGLMPISVNKTEPVSLQEETQKTNIIKVSWGKRALRYAASFLLLMFMTFILTTPTHIDEQSSEYASLSFVRQHEQIANKIESFNGELLIAAPEKADTIQQSEADSKLKTLVQTFSDEQAQYFISIASFPTEDLAHSYIAQHRNKGFHLLVNDDKFIIYCASSNSVEALKSYIKTNRIDEQYPESWIYSAK